MEGLRQNAKVAAILSFIGGTIILLLFIITSNYDLAFFGIFYIYIVVLINSIIWLLLLIKIVKDKSNRKYWTKTLLMSLINIPIMLIYILIGGFMSSIMRVTFANSKPNLITNIQVVGKNNLNIDLLEPNESETLWIPINDDISINIKYKYKDSIITETVIQYIDRGKIMKYNIGQKRETRLIIK